MSCTCQQIYLLNIQKTLIVKHLKRSELLAACAGWLDAAR